MANTTACDSPNDGMGLMLDIYLSAPPTFMKLIGNTLFHVYVTLV